MTQGLLLGVGIPVLVVALLLLSWMWTNGRIARSREALEPEGIVLDSGRRWIRVKYRNFRSGGMVRGVGSSNVPGQLVLTGQRLAVLMGRQLPFADILRSDLGRLCVDTAGDALCLQADDLPGATGSIEYRVRVGNAEAWVKALTEAGARRRS